MSPPVLIVGAGPTGLSLAVELRRRDVPVRLIDRAPGCSDAPRALGIQARTLELLDRIGVAEAARARGTWITGFRLHADGQEEADLPHRLEAQGTAWTGSLMLHQTETERLLERRLEALGGHVEWGTTFLGADPKPDGWQVRLRDADGAETQHDATWLAGADGGGSDVRKAMGASFDGQEDVTWLVAVLDAAPDLPRDRVHLLRHPEGNLVLFPFGPGRRWHLVDTAPPGGADVDPEAERASVARRLRDALGRPVPVRGLPHLSPWTIPQRRAGTMRAGQGLLLGDAAHVNSPASGRGMNAGIEDAFALGWRLALMLRGRAGEALLDDWDRRRRDAARELLQVSWLGTRLLEERPAPLHRAIGRALRWGGRRTALRDRVAALYTGRMSGLPQADRWPALPDGLRDAPEGRALDDWCHAQRDPAAVLIGADDTLLDGLPAWMPRMRLGAGDLPDPEGRLAAHLGPGLVVVSPDGEALVRLKPGADAATLAARLSALGLDGASTSGRRAA